MKESLKVAVAANLPPKGLGCRGLGFKIWGSELNPKPKRAMLYRAWGSGFSS